jgi:hypothetical protein
MDPVTAALNLASQILAFASKIWDATPPAMQAANAANWAQFIHNIGDVLLSLQSKINAIGK